MKTLTLVLVIAALSTAGAAIAGARPAAAHSVTPVTVAMHDPGCHWFSVGGKLLTKLTVQGTAKVSNYDEATIRIAGPHGTKLTPVGKSVLLGRGVYTITMVKQASDDNHLKLIVR